MPWGRFPFLGYNKAIMNHSISEHTFASGLRLQLIDMPNATSLDIRIFVCSGYGQAPRNKYEIPHLLEHMLFSGNTDLPKASDFTSAMEKVTAQWRGLTNYRHNYFTYSKSPAHLDRFFELVKAQLLSPIFTEEGLKEQKGVITQELSKQLIGDAEQCSAESLAFALPVLSPKIRIETLGTINLNDVITFHARHFQPDNMSICITGDISRSSKEIINILSSWEGKPSQINSASYEPNEANRVRMAASTKPGRSFIQLDMLKSGFNPTDIPAIRVIQSIWHTSKSSRFYQAIRPLGYSYSPIVSVALTHSYLRVILIDSLSDEHVLDFIEAFIDEYRDIVQNGPTEPELENAKALLAEREAVNFATPQQLGEYYAEHWAMGDTPLTISEYTAAVQALSLEDIKRLGQSYLDNMHIVVRTGLEEAEKTQLQTSLEQLVRNKTT
jgi:predicted Zn-dependent peptidase